MARRKARPAETVETVESDSALDRLARSVPPLIAATTFGTAWLAPASLSHAVLYSLRASIVLEFLAIHSGAFLGVLLARAVSGSGRRAGGSLVLALPLVAIYLGAAWGLSRQTQSWWPLAAAAWLLAVRLVPLAQTDVARRDAAIGRVLAEWACALGVFIIAAVVVQNVELPLSGLTAIDAADFPIKGWSTPLTMAQEIQLGTLHFIGLALLPWFVHMPALGTAMATMVDSTAGKSKGR